MTVCLVVAGKEDSEAAQPETGPKMYKAPAFDAPDSENPKKQTPILETEAEFVRYKRQRTVRSCCCFAHPSKICVIWTLP